MYCTRLNERAFAKEVVHDYQLMDKYFFSKEKPKRRLTQEEKYDNYVVDVFKLLYFFFFNFSL